MIKYEIGKQFPHPQYLGKGEITIAMLNAAFFDVVCVLNGIMPNERKDWRKGKLTVCLYEQASIPFICFVFESWNFDVNINISKVQPDKIDDWLNSEGNIINLFLVDAITGKLEAMRMISIPQSMAEQIRDICEQQSDCDLSEIDKTIQATLSGISTQFMIQHAEIKFKL